MRHLKHLNVTAKAEHKDAAQESLSSDNEVAWSDDELDEQSELTITRLFHNARNMSASKRPLRYIGNSTRTQKRRKADAKKQAAKNGQTLLAFFSTGHTSASAPLHEAAGGGEDANKDNDITARDVSVPEATSESEDQSLVDSESDTCSEDGCLSNQQAIDVLERRLCEKSSQQQWRLVAVLQYLRLLKFEQSKMNASLYVARQLGRDAYMARRI